VIVVLGFFYEMGVDEGRAMPMVVVIMGMKERSSKQYLEHGHNAETRTEPSHQERFWSMLESLSTRATKLVAKRCG
jgi:hypothetical protein